MFLFAFKFMKTASELQLTEKKETEREKSCSNNNHRNNNHSISQIRLYKINNLDAVMCEGMDRRRRGKYVSIHI